MNTALGRARAAAKGQQAAVAASPEVQQAFGVFGSVLSGAWRNGSAQMPAISAARAGAAAAPGPRYINTYRLQRKAGKLEVLPSARRKAKPGALPSVSRLR